ncbi:sperm-associated antigen 16 protein-like [Pholidichthys leucotaenia]
MSAKRRERSEENKEGFPEEERRCAEEEDFEEALREAPTSSAAPRRKPGPPRRHISPTPEPVDDFLRNFLRRLGLSRTLSSFEAEWYGSAQKHLKENLSSTEVPFIPDALTHQQLLLSELDTVRRETEELREEVLAARESLVRVQRERDFHRLQYGRVSEEKNQLIKDLKELRKHLGSYEPAMRQLDDKCQATLRQKTLISLQKARLQNTKDTRASQQKENKKATAADKSPPENTTRHPKDSEFPRMVKTHLPEVIPQTEKSSFSLFCSMRAHKLPISCIHLHPRKRILASASDDHTWRLWALPAPGQKVGQMLLTGEEHSDWLSGCSFHPDGSKLATTSGDTTVRLWDFACGLCVLTLSGHTQPTWGCSFHSSGHFLASCSADRTAKLWDLNSQRCRFTMRRHVASVNSVCFLTASNLLLTCSADKTLALWDARLGVCTAIFHGHQHPCNHGAFTLAGDIVASCDFRGVVNLWDTRKTGSPVATTDAGPMGANQVAFSQSGKMLAVASSDGLVRLVEVDSSTVSSLVGHSGSVQSVTFDHQRDTVISAGSDGMIKIWS